MHEHISDALRLPALVKVEPGLVCVRFETMKILSALAAVRSLIESGRVAPNDTLIDSSSGIYAYALALACHRYGMRCYIVGSTTVDRTLRVQLEILGATLEQVQPSDSLELDQKLRVARIREILAQNPSFYWMQQYHNQVHYLGYVEAAALIAREVPRAAITLTGGVGSGASTAGIAHYLRALGRDVDVVGVQPFGSLTFGSDRIEDRQIIIAGIGSSIEFRNVKHELYERIHWVGFEPAAAGAVELLRKAAIFAGLSTGAAYLAARWESFRDDTRAHLFVAADTGHRYVDAVYAKHGELHELGLLTPKEIGALSELAAPWSTMKWSGRLVSAIEARGGHCLPCDFNLRATQSGIPVAAEMEEVLPRAQAVVATGMTLANGSFDRILAHCRAAEIPLVIYAQTGSAVARAFLHSGVTAVCAEPFPFSQFSAEPTRLYRYRSPGRRNEMHA